MVGSECELLGLSRPWISGRNRTAMRWLPAVQPQMVINIHARHLEHVLIDADGFGEMLEHEEGEGEVVQPGQVSGNSS